LWEEPSDCDVAKDKATGDNPRQVHAVVDRLVPADLTSSNWLQDLELGAMRGIRTPLTRFVALMMPEYSRVGTFCVICTL